MKGDGVFLASLNDVAKAAGVSITTASFVINGHAEDMRIAPHTAEKVLEAVRKLEYVPNVSAKKLTNRIDRSSTIPEIAILWAPSLHPAFLGSFITNAQELFDQELVREMHITVSPFTINHINNLENDFLDRYYNGVIVSPIYDKEFSYINNIATRIPLVVLHVRSDKHHNVIVDNYITGRKAAEIFAARGHRSAAMFYVRNVGATSEPDYRLRGFSETCFTHNMDFFGVEVPFESLGLTVARSMYGRQKALEFLQNKKLPEAIFIQDDVISMGFITTLLGAGVRIPDDIEIITYGSNDIADACHPSITTIDYPISDITREALQLLSAQLSNPFSQPKLIVVTPTVTFRESCPKPDGWE